MKRAPLGKTGLMVSRLGYGLSNLGRGVEEEASAAEAGRALNLALDKGINFLDTAACYENSEETIGHFISHRRGEYLLATKCGHATGGLQGEPWEAETIRRSIERSLKRMRTDYVDLMQLHSCDLDVLKRGEAIEALEMARDAGKTRFIGYSGDNEDALWAIESGVFDALQVSLSLVDQLACRELLQAAEEKEMGIIIKRPVANGAWGVPASPSRYADHYFDRAQRMLELGPIPGAPEDRQLLAVGFVFAHPEVDTAIVGTRNPAHMQANIDLVENRLPIAEEAVAELHHRFERLGKDWKGLL